MSRGAFSRRTIQGALISAGLILSLLAVVPAAPAQQSKVIQEATDDYREYCSDCHGPLGRGDGKMAAILVTPPTDLTEISEPPEMFPFWRVYDVIAGEIAVAGHDTFQMPRFGARLQKDVGKPGYLPPHIRILLLTHFVENLQARQPSD